MSYPTDQKLLWEGNEKENAVMCEASGRLGIHRPRTKYLDVESANMGYVDKGTRLLQCVKMHKRLFGVEVKNI